MKRLVLRDRSTLARCGLLALIAGSLALEAGLPAASANSSLPGVLNYWEGKFVVRPPWIDLTPTDGETVGGSGGTFQHPTAITWTTWTRSEARGTGVLWVDTCEVSCAASPKVRYRAKIRAFDRQGNRFTRLTVASAYGHGQFRMVVQPGFGGKFVPVSG